MEPRAASRADASDRERTRTGGASAISPSPRQGQLTYQLLLREVFPLRPCMELRSSLRLVKRSSKPTSKYLAGTLPAAAQAVSGHFRRGRSDAGVFLGTDERELGR
jgi:hypothetical protein